MADNELVTTRAEPSVMALMGMALEKGLVDQLKELVALKNGQDDREAKMSYAHDMNAAQSDMPVIVKDAENSHTRSRYSRMEQIIHAIKPVYTKHGFSLSFSEGDCPKEGQMRILCEVHHTGGHTRDYHLDLPLDGIGAKGNASSMNAPQAKGSTFAYGQRYLTSKIFNLVIADEDLDGNKPGATLNEQQIELAEKWIRECEGFGALTVRVRWLKWLGVEAVADITQSRWPEARDNLIKARDKAKRDFDSSGGIK